MKYVKLKYVKLYEEYLYEEDGYGRDFFIKRKEGKTYKYYFKIESEYNTLCFVLNISKISRKIYIDSPENSYGVLSVEPIKESVMDDYLVNKTPYKSRTSDIFELTNNELIKFYKIISEAIKDYLENNPKVFIIYDEILLNLNMDEDEYFDKVKSLMTMWSYDRWTIQESSSKKVFLYSRRVHE